MTRTLTWLNTSALPFQCLHGLRRFLPRFWLACSCKVQSGFTVKMHLAKLATQHILTRITGSWTLEGEQALLNIVWGTQDEDAKTSSPGQKGCHISALMGSHSQSVGRLPMCQSLAPCPCSRQMHMFLNSPNDGHQTAMVQHACAPETVVQVE